MTRWLDEEEMARHREKDVLRLRKCAYLRRRSRERRPRPEDMFMRRARHKRTEANVLLARRIMRDNMRDGTERLFFTHAVFLDDEPLAWADVWFPSVADKGVVYHALVQTAQKKFAAEIEARAVEDVHGRLTREEEEIEERSAWDMVPAEKDPLTGRVLSWTRREEGWPSHASLGGKTVHEAIGERKRELYGKMPFLAEYSVLKMDSPNAVRLDVTLPDIFMTAAAIDELVRRFRENGEACWKIPFPAFEPDRDPEWMEKRGIAMGLSLGNWTRRDCPKWAREKDGNVPEWNVRLLKEYLAKEER